MVNNVSTMGKPGLGSAALAAEQASNEASPTRGSSSSSAPGEGSLLRADLHVHSWHSGHANHMRFLRARDCYSDPEAVYRAAKARGMDLVTITDHDSIGGCLEFLDRHPDAGDFFISEEIECLVPGLPLKVHIGAYDINERIHRDVQPLRRSVFETAAYLRQQGVFFTLNHLFFFLHGQMPLGDYLDALLPLFCAFVSKIWIRIDPQDERAFVFEEFYFRDVSHRVERIVARIVLYAMERFFRERCRTEALTQLVCNGEQSIPIRPLLSFTCFFPQEIGET